MKLGLLDEDKELQNESDRLQMWKKELEDTISELRDDCLKISTELELNKIWRYKIEEQIGSLYNLNGLQGHPTSVFEFNYEKKYNTSSSNTSSDKTPTKVASPETTFIFGSNENSPEFAFKFYKEPSIKFEVYKKAEHDSKVASKQLRYLRKSISKEKGIRKGNTNHCEKTEFYNPNCTYEQQSNKCKEMQNESPKLIAESDGNINNCEKTEYENTSFAPEQQYSTCKEVQIEGAKLDGNIVNCEKTKCERTNCTPEQLNKYKEIQIEGAKLDAENDGKIINCEKAKCESTSEQLKKCEESQTEAAKLDAENDGNINNCEKTNNPEKTKCENANCISEQQISEAKEVIIEGAKLDAENDELIAQREKTDWENKNCTFIEQPGRIKEIHIECPKIRSSEIITGIELFAECRKAVSQNNANCSFEQQCNKYKGIMIEDKKKDAGNVDKTPHEQNYKTSITPIENEKILAHKKSPNKIDWQNEINLEMKSVKDMVLGLMKQMKENSKWKKHIEKRINDLEFIAHETDFTKLNIKLTKTT